MPYDEKDQKNEFSNQKSISRRWAVFYLFIYKYKGLEPENGDYYHYWTGEKGVAAKIRKDLGLHAHSGYKLVPIFEYILECSKIEKDFEPEDLETRGGGRPANIAIDSLEAQIVAGSIESGLSLRRTWHNVNFHRKESNPEFISESSVHTVLRKLRQKVREITKRKRGDTCASSDWAQARKLWCTQRLVRFG